MGTKSRRERERKERKAEIIKAARKLFFKDGFEKTTMPMIAKETELAAGTLYLYFPSKESIYVELLYEGYDLLLKKMEASVNTDLSPRDQAARFIDIFMDFANEHPNYFEILFFVIQREGKGILDINLTKEQYHKLKSYQETIVRVSSRFLINSGIIKNKNDADDTVSAVWSMLAGVVLYFLHDGEEVFERMRTAAENIILKGLFTE